MSGQQSMNKIILINEGNRVKNNIKSAFTISPMSSDTRRGIVSPAVHSNAVLGNVLSAGFARKAAKPKADDEKDFQAVLRALERSDEKVRMEREKRERRKGIKSEEEEEEFQNTQTQQEIDPFAEQIAAPEIVYDEELKGYFRKDAVQKLKADPDFMKIIKKLENPGEDEDEPKRLKRKRARAKKSENHDSDSIDGNKLEEISENQPVSEQETLHIDTKNEQIAHPDQQNFQTDMTPEQKTDEPSALQSESENEDDIFHELDELMEKPVKKPEKNKNSQHNITKKTEKPNPLTTNQFVIKLDPKTLQRAKKIVKHEEKQKETNKKQNVPALYIDFRNTKEVSTFVNDQSIDLFNRALKKLSPSSMTKLLADTNFIDKDPPRNTLKMLLLITHMRRHALLKNYDRPDIREHVQKIIENLSTLSPEIVTMLVYNLDKMRINEPEYFRKLETFIITHAPKFNLRCLSNIVFSFANTSMRQSIFSDFSQLYKSLEIPISLRLKEKRPKDLAQIMTGYSKTQNFSNEFLQVMEKACFDLKEELNTQELAVILHSFWKNNHRPEKLLEHAKKKLLEEPEKFKIMEMAILTEAFDGWGVFDEPLFNLVEKQFLTKSENVNAQDVAAIYKVILKPEFKPQAVTFAKFNEVLGLLFDNIDSNCLRKMFEGYPSRFEVGHTTTELDNLLIRRLRILVKDRRIRGENYRVVVDEINNSLNEKIRAKIRELTKRAK